MGQATRQALIAVKVAKWVAFVAAFTAGKDGFLLIFFAVFLLAVQDRIERGGVTAEHPGVLLLFLGPFFSGQVPVVQAAHCIGAMGVAIVLLQRVLHLREPGHPNLFLAACTGLAAFFVVRVLPYEPAAYWMAGMLVFLAWCAGHGHYVGVTTVLTGLLLIAFGIGTAPWGIPAVAVGFALFWMLVFRPEKPAQV